MRYTFTLHDLRSDVSMYAHGSLHTVSLHHEIMKAQNLKHATGFVFDNCYFAFPKNKCIAKETRGILNSTT